MIDRFKLRFLIVLILIASCTLMMNNQYYRQMLLPVLGYVMEPNETLEEAISIIVSGSKEVPVVTKSDAPFAVICQYQSVRQGFGWYQAAGEEKFSNGVYLITDRETPVMAPLGGEIQKVMLTDSTIGVLQQCGDYTCFYSGLEALMVEEGKQVQAGEVLGYSGSLIYFEVHDVNGAINPEFVLTGK